MRVKIKLLNDIKEKCRSGVISADVLKIVAVVTMIIDHIWQAGLVEPRVFNWVGRVAFPIFAFQVAEGYTRTADVKKYGLRLLVFALISEIPFNIFCSGNLFFPSYQNVLFTLLLGLISLIIVERMKKDPTATNICLCVFGVVVIVILAELLKLDYGGAGVLTVLSFFVFRGLKNERIIQLLSMVFIFTVLFPGNDFAVAILGELYFLPVQIFALFSLVPIWLYNGKKGKYSKAVQYGFYAVYPVHLMVIYIIKWLCS